MKPHTIVEQTCEALTMLFSGFAELSDDSDINLNVKIFFEI